MDEDRFEAFVQKGQHSFQRMMEVGGLSCQAKILVDLSVDNGGEVHYSLYGCI